MPQQPNVVQVASNYDSNEGCPLRPKIGTNIKWTTSSQVTTSIPTPPTPVHRLNEHVGH